MKFDSIIACGDSFTKYHITPIKHSWPYLLGQHYNVPVANLGKGGASNFEIALQPLQYMPDNMEDFDNPLIIFGMTTPFRLPVYYPKETRIGSLASVLPEHLTYTEATGVDGKVFESTIKKMLVDDAFHQADIQILEMILRWKELIKGSTIVWGRIHFQHQEPDGVVNHNALKDEQARIISLHNYLQDNNFESNCFNEVCEWFPLQHVLRGEPNMHIDWAKFNTGIKILDGHPSEAGIIRFADNIIKYIDSNIRCVNSDNTEI